MIGAVIENLSNRKLVAILASLFVAQVLFFLLGAIFAPGPSTSMEFLMLACRDPSAGRDTTWFHIRPDNCDEIRSLHGYKSGSDDARDIVFIAQMPHVRQGIQLEYSTWFQFLLGFLEIEMLYGTENEQELDGRISLELEIRMGYKEKGWSDDRWAELVSSTVRRTLECTIDDHKKQPGVAYNCTTIDLFELGSNPHPFYLLNIRIPVNRTMCGINSKAPNCRLGPINELRLIAVHQNGGFTFIWLWMKTLVSPIVAFALFWYYNRVRALNRSKLLVEKAILVLGLILLALDFPLEWLSIWRPFPALLIVSDIRQGLFYSALFSFWLIFTGEHLIDDGTRNNLKNYWRNLSLVLTASVALLLYDVGGRGMQLIDPFYSIWSRHSGHPFLASSTIFLAAASAIAYFVFLCYKVWNVWTTIRQKRSAQLYKLSEYRRLKVEAVIYRFKFLMILTLTCAASTIVSYALQQYGEGHPSFANGNGSDELPSSSSAFNHSASAFFTGTFGLWNIYVLLLLFMYAPSHKHYTNAQVLEDENEDLIMDSTTGTESTMMTTFFKQAAD